MNEFTDYLYPNTAFNRWSYSDCRIPGSANNIRYCRSSAAGKTPGGHKLLERNRNRFAFPITNISFGQI
jgi:hypothetical protein